MRAVHAWLLDLDGTLVDTHDANVAAYAKAISSAIPRARINSENLRSHIVAGESCTNFVPTLVPNATDIEVNEVARVKRAFYPNFLNLSRLNDILVQRVRDWRAKGGLAVLVTTAKEPNARAVLSYHGIADLFDSYIFGDEIERLKPSPDIYYLAMDKLDLTPSECLVFEDSESGSAAAHAAGLEVEIVRDW